MTAPGGSRLPRLVGSDAGAVSSMVSGRRQSVREWLRELDLCVSLCGDTCSTVSTPSVGAVSAAKSHKISLQFAMLGDT